MTDSRRALITGITGQDGSYLAELLLEKGYEVHGMVRRSSTETFQRLEGIRDEITLHTGDLLDQRSLVDVLRELRAGRDLQPRRDVVRGRVVEPAGADGRVHRRRRDADARGDARGAAGGALLPGLLVRDVRKGPRGAPARDDPLLSALPVRRGEGYGHFITVNYRESYDLFACSGILFNHECLHAQLPLIVRETGVQAVRTPPDLVPLRGKGPSVQTFEPDGLLEVWDGEDWTPVRAITATRRRAPDPDHRLISIQARGGVVEATAHHRMLDADDEEVRADALEEGERLALCEEMPHPPLWTVISEEMAEFLGLLVADGWVGRDGRSASFTNNDPESGVGSPSFGRACSSGRRMSGKGLPASIPTRGSGSSTSTAPSAPAPGSASSSTPRPPTSRCRHSS